MARLGKPPDDTYFDAVCGFHEQGGDLEAALAERQRQQQVIAGRGQFATECVNALHRCRLLAKMGQGLEAMAAEVRTVAARLRRPGYYLERLERILGGDTALW
jgi:hypothetical protein